MIFPTVCLLDSISLRLLGLELDLFDESEMVLGRMHLRWMSWRFRRGLVLALSGIKMVTLSLIIM